LNRSTMEEYLHLQDRLKIYYQEVHRNNPGNHLKIKSKFEGRLRELTAHVNAQGREWIREKFPKIYALLGDLASKKE
jgi:hypothetical protein